MNSKLLAATFIMALAGAAAQGQSVAPPPPPAIDQAEAPIAPLPLAVALKAVRAAMDLCHSLGLAPTVTYVDREGVARIVLVADGAGPLSITTSRRKAWTAAAIGVSTFEFAKGIAALHVDPASVDPQLIQLAGGIQILRKGIMIGGIGVGGAESPTYPGSADTRCATAGVDAIKAELEQ